MCPFYEEVCAKWYGPSYQPGAYGFAPCFYCAEAGEGTSLGHVFEHVNVPQPRRNKARRI